MHPRRESAQLFVARKAARSLTASTIGIRVSTGSSPRQRYPTLLPKMPAAQPQHKPSDPAVRKEEPQDKQEETPSFSDDEELSSQGNTGIAPKHPYFGEDCTCGFIEQADVELIAEKQPLPAHSQLLIKASPVLADLISQRKVSQTKKGSKKEQQQADEQPLLHIEIDGSRAAVVMFLALIYAPILSQTLDERMQRLGEKAVQSTLLLAGKLQAAAVLSNADLYFAQRAADRFFSVKLMTESLDWLKFACELDLKLTVPFVEHCFISRPESLALMPEALDVSEAACLPYIQSLLHIMRAGVKVAKGQEVLVDSMKGWAKAELPKKRKAQGSPGDA